MSVLHDAEIRFLADGWIEHHLKSKDAAVDEATFWAWERLDDLVREQPEFAWEVIEAIRLTNGTDWILGMIAAGPLEDLLAEHGEQFIDRVETLSRRDAQFRKLLGGVWRNSMSEKVWLRLKAVAGPPF